MGQPLTATIDGFRISTDSDESGELSELEKAEKDVDAKFAQLRELRKRFTNDPRVPTHLKDPQRECYEKKEDGTWVGPLKESDKVHRAAVIQTRPVPRKGA